MAADGAPQAADGHVHPPVHRFAHGSRVPGWDRAADLTKAPAEVPDPATTYVPAELREQIEAQIARYPDRRSAALPALAAAQRLHGWCSPDAIRQVAAVMRLTPAYLSAVATFYDMLDTSPAGRHRVYVCTNISCSLNGADALFERFEAEAGDDPDFNVRHFECLGACDMAPMASVDGVYVGPIELGEVRELLEEVRAGRPPLPAKQIAQRKTTDPGANTRDWPDEAAEQADLATAREGLPIRPSDEDTFGERMDEDLGGEQVSPVEESSTGSFDQGFPQKTDESL